MFISTTSSISIFFSVIAISVLFSLCCCFSLLMYVAVKLVSFLCFGNSRQKSGEMNPAYQTIELTNNDDYNIVYQPLSEEIPVVQAYLVPPLTMANADNLNPNHETDVIGDKKISFRDKWAAIIFLVQFSSIIIYSFYEVVNILNNSIQYQNIFVNNEEVSLLKLCTCIFIIIAISSSLIGAFWITFLIRNAERIIELMLWGSTIFLALFSLIFFISLQFVGGAIFAALALLSYLYWRSVSKSIPFSSAVVVTACKGLQRNYCGILITIITSQFIQIIWYISWSISTYILYRAVHKSNNSDSNMSSFLLFLMMVCVFWGQQTILGVVQTTVAGTLACWWFQPQLKAPVRGSLFRATTTSFGSICFGSLIVAFIQALRNVLESIKSRERDRNRNNLNNIPIDCIVAAAKFILDRIDWLLKYFNKYAYCYIAAYGTDFMTSGKQVTNLFIKRGMMGVINDDLIGRAMFLGTIIISLFSSLVGIALTYSLHTSILSISKNDGYDVSIPTILFIGGLTGMLIGWLIGSLLTITIESAVAMVFVCFAENPSSLQTNHLEVYNNLCSKWARAYPDNMDWIEVSSVANPIALNSNIIYLPYNMEDGTSLSNTLIDDSHNNSYKQIEPTVPSLFSTSANEYQWNSSNSYSHNSKNPPPSNPNHYKR
eukprot:gene9157-12353_t